MSVTTVFTIEDEPLLRELLKEYISMTDHLELIGSSGDGQEAIRLVLEEKPDLIILDIRLPEVNGLEILVLLKRKLPDTKIVVFSGSTSGSTIKMAMQGGADGFVEKAAGLEAMREGIDAVLKGETFLSSGAKRLAGV